MKNKNIKKIVGFTFLIFTIMFIFSLPIIKTRLKATEPGMIVDYSMSKTSVSEDTTDYYISYFYKNYPFDYSISIYDKNSQIVFMVQKSFNKLNYSIYDERHRYCALEKTDDGFVGKMESECNIEEVSNEINTNLVEMNLYREEHDLLKY